MFYASFKIDAKGNPTMEAKSDFLAWCKTMPEKTIHGPLKKLVAARSRGREGEKGNQLGYFFGSIVPVYQRKILCCLKKDEAYYYILNEFSYEMKPSKNGKPIKHLIHVDDEMPMDKMTQLIETCLMDASINHGEFIEDPDPSKSRRYKNQKE